MKKAKLKVPRLEPEPRRGDLTVREMVSILGGLVGSLCENAPPTKVREAVTWWAVTDAAWQFDGKISAKIAAAIKDRQGQGGLTPSALSSIVADITTKEE
jgi:hypothetical protein